MSVANVVTLCSNRAYQNDEAENLFGSRTKSAEGKAEASKNLRARKALPTCWIAAVSAAEEKLTTKNAKSTKKWEAV
ncbi:MAG: hypothetical protein IKW80_12035, partial [Thermoguttaceae bacterium]|nr:hypothetical protein [Thermoguttaceae bacterium]